MVVWGQFQEPVYSGGKKDQIAYERQQTKG